MGFKLGVCGDHSGLHLQLGIIVVSRLIWVFFLFIFYEQIDIEGHEGHFVAGAEQLFKTLDVHMVYMEWENVIRKFDYGGVFVLDFMKRHTMVPFDLHTLKRLQGQYQGWPADVLWLKAIYVERLLKTFQPKKN